MNHCRKCQSDYEKPGTCNCFAPVVAAPQPVFVSPSWMTCGLCGAWHTGAHICARSSTGTILVGGYITDSQS